MRRVEMMKVVAEMEALKIIGTISGIIFGIMALAVWGSNVYEGYSCQKKAEMMNYHYQYTMATGCMVQIDNNRYVPLRNLNFFM